jgi:hypothetical protein
LGVSEDPGQKILRLLALEQSTFEWEATPIAEQKSFVKSREKSMSIVTKK